MLETQNIQASQELESIENEILKLEKLKGITKDLYNDSLMKELEAKKLNVIARL